MHWVESWPKLGVRGRDQTVEDYHRGPPHTDPFHPSLLLSPEPDPGSWRCDRSSSGYHDGVRVESNCHLLLLKLFLWTFPLGKKRSRVRFCWYSFVSSLYSSSVPYLEDASVLPQNIELYTVWSLVGRKQHTYPLNVERVRGVLQGNLKSLVNHEPSRCNV